MKQALKDFGYDDDVVDKIYSSKAKRAFSSAAALLKSMQNENLRGNIKALLQAAGMEDFDVGLLEQSLLAEVEKHPVSEPAAKKPRQDDVPAHLPQPRLAPTVPVLQTGGKPSTSFPPEDS